MKMSYWIKDEKKTTLSHIPKNSINEILDTFILIEEIDIFASIDKTSVVEKLRNDFSNWVFMIDGNPYTMSTLLHSVSKKYYNIEKDERVR